MVSRDTAVQVGVVLVYVALMLVWSLVTGGVGGSDSMTAVDLLFGLGSLFLVFAGGHLYLAWRGEGGMVPVDARWRFVVVAALTMVLAVAGLSMLDADPVAGISPHLPVFGVLVALLVGYFVYEAREGYLERSPS